MPDVCPKCGLNKDICVCETIAKEEQRIRIRTVKRRYGKLTTLVEGLDATNIDVKEIAKMLKSKLACGGTTKQGIIELQGDHKQNVKDALIQQGFNEDTIDVM